MKRSAMIAGLSLAGVAAFAAAATLVAVGGLFGGSDGSSAANGSDVSQLGSAAPAHDQAPGTLGEGIQVHGDWVIEVRNADGSLAERRAFENALHAQGQLFLANVLARQFFVGQWAVHLSGSSSPCTFNAGVGACLVHESGNTFWDLFGGVEKFPTLTITTDPAPCCGGTTLVLQGQFNASRDGDIGGVLSQACFSLPPNPSPTICNNAFTFTGTALGTPVNVIAGQQVLVTVRISFS